MEAFAGIVWTIGSALDPTNENRDLLFDLIKHLREQNRRQKIAFALVIAGLTAAFAAAVIVLNAHWLALVAELMTA